VKGRGERLEEEGRMRVRMREGRIEGGEEEEENG
jgi:hypothetical protein